ncbi:MULTISPECIES: hypothetical protein [Streptomyces]|uniref:hypothetical protein n=1 Tax=Streptomyces TaxID=1883 RepID=UPI0002419D15|nr:MULTISPECIES: hypothetical protein [Streptomyces]EHM29795.1 hypothetical protein SPW_1719 [Streptomyces sp. W007]MCX4487765.1 hypothetical protein [Streptomyces anulatus]WSU77113.1 hypothetical protein OG499_31025 [Streptomyces anulatus]WTD24475.1 hypothetical protein OH737_08075 [Streptomyces anulatus]
MTLNYQDVVTADLSFFTDVAGAWKKMGERFGELKTDYAQNVQAMLTNGNWQGEAFGAQQNSAAATAFEFGAAKAEALAIASLLTDAQTELTRLQKAVKELVADAEKKDYTVDNAGKATYVGYDNLSAQEKYAFQHDPDHTRLLADAREKAQGWTDTIAKAVKAVDDADQSVKRALSRATNDVSMDGTGIGGFNSRAEGDLAKAGKPDPKPGKKDGWVAETDSEASGPGVGTDASGPNIGKGKLAEAEAHADLGRAKGEGTLTNGPTKLAGEAEAYAGAKASAAAGVTQEGAQAETKGFAGGEASASGTADAGPVGVYGRAEAMAGAEAGANAQAGMDGVVLSAEAFAGAKASAGAGADIGGLGAGVTVEGWAGPGAEATLNGSKDANGVWRFGPKVGLSPALGGAVGFEFTVDPGKVVDTVGDAAGAVGDAASWVGDGIGSLF